MWLTVAGEPYQDSHAGTPAAGEGSTSTPPGQRLHPPAQRGLLLAMAAGYQWQLFQYQKGSQD